MKIYSLAILLVFQFSFVFDLALESPQPSSHVISQQKQKIGEAVATNIIFKSTDGGVTWQDISQGLPENLQADAFVEKDGELYVRTRNEVYHGRPNSLVPSWKKEILPGEQSSIAPGKVGVFAFNYDGQFLHKIKGTGLWLPMYTSFQEKGVRTIFETERGTVFIGSDKGIFKSANIGKTWKQVHTGGWVMKLVESNGVLLATSQGGILRSTDDGESWNYVISEGGVGIAVERINGGFAAITYNTISEIRRVRTSYDGGKTWQAIDGGLPSSLLVSSIQQIGEYLLCGHPDGIFRSSDKGKTWKLLLPSLENQVFDLSVSGNVIYAIPRAAGC